MENLFSDCKIQIKETFFAPNCYQGIGSLTMLSEKHYYIRRIIFENCINAKNIV